MPIGVINPHFYEDDFYEGSGYVYPQQKHPRLMRRECRHLGMTHNRIIGSFDGGTTEALRNLKLGPWTGYSFAYLWTRAGFETRWPVSYGVLSQFHFSSEDDMNHFLVLWRLGAWAD